MSETSTVLPVSASESGKNAYYLPNCDVVEHVPAYCSCLDKIKSIKARVKGYASECASALRQDRCKAANMRQEEELKGQALFFIPRVALERTESTGEPIDWSARMPTKRRPRATPTTNRITDAGGSFADAINEAMRALPESPKPTLPAPMMVAGESPMQYARRIAATA